MSLPRWLRALSRVCFASPTPTRRSTARRRPPERVRVRPSLESLEDRIVPTTTISVGPTTANLIQAIDTADHTPGPVALNLPANTTYVLTQPDDTQTYLEDQNWYGPDGLPAIDNNITINGNGSTIQRGTAGLSPPPFRFFFVSGGMGLPPGSLVLNNLSCQVRFRPKTPEMRQSLIHARSLTGIY